MIYRSLLVFILALNLWKPLWGDSPGLLIREEQAAKATGSDIHGYIDVVFKNDYITPRGLLVTDTGLTMQILTGYIIDVYKSSQGIMNEISLNLGIWNDLWTNQHHPFVGSWNELDWFVGANFSFNQWMFGIQFIEFLSPPNNFKPENNIQFTLTYHDRECGWPVIFNPYAQFFWAISGDSTVIVGKRGGTYYLELGMLPTLDLTEVIFFAPTWLSIGPPSFWNGGKLGLKDENSHFGVFSTGLKGQLPLKQMPKRLGKWYLDGGIQYYYLINDNLLQAQIQTLGLSSIEKAHRNIVVFYGGIGFEF